MSTDDIQEIEVLPLPEVVLDESSVVSYSNTNTETRRVKNSDMSSDDIQEVEVLPLPEVVLEESRVVSYSNESLAGLLDHLCLIISMFENKEVQEYALSHIPVTEIRRRVLTRFGQLRIGRIANHVRLYAYRLLFLEEMAKWFKDEFFTWLHSPTCRRCNLGMIYCQEIESSKPKLSTFAEVYKCQHCENFEYLSRFIHPKILLATREGRCSEYALCFTLLCRALNFRARYVYDVTDHCWTEVYSSELKRWIHVDPCEGVVNRPLLYEQGWKKNLTYVFAVSGTEIQDVTWRYTSQHNLVLSRRDYFQNDFVINEIIRQRNIMLAQMSEADRLNALKEVVMELVDLLVEPVPNGSYGTRISPEHFAI